MAFRPLHTLFIFAALHCAQFGPNSILRSSCHFTYIACGNVLARQNGIIPREVQVIFCAWLSVGSRVRRFQMSFGLSHMIHEADWCHRIENHASPTVCACGFVYPAKIHISFDFVPIGCHSRPIRPYLSRPNKSGCFLRPTEYWTLFRCCFQSIHHSTFSF